MGFTNYHTHSSFCDAVGKPEEYVLEAIKCGLKAIGFSSHAPLPFENNWTLQENRVDEYCRVIRSLKAKYKNLIQIYLGLEIDYFAEYAGNGFSKYEELNLDYTIGSVHYGGERIAGEYTYIHTCEEDFLKILHNCFNNNVREFVCSYFQTVRDMVITIKPNIIGHLDLIKKFNCEDKYFSESQEWYKTEVLNTLKVIAENGCILEVNTSGIAKGFTQEFYPSTWILKEARKLNIPVMINSDAHRPQDINAKFLEAVEALIKAGYSTQKILHIQT